MASENLVSEFDLTLGAASGAQVITHGLVCDGGPSFAHKFDLERKTDCTATFRWWVTAHTNSQCTLNWAGGAATQNVRFRAQRLHSLLTSAAPTGW
jgi:hypothetical protein